MFTAPILANTTVRTSMSVPRWLAVMALCVVLGAASPLATYAGTEAAKKPFSIQVANGLRRPLVVRINRHSPEQVNYHDGSRIYRSNRRSFTVRVFLVKKNGRLSRLFRGKVPTSWGNGHGRVKMTFFRNHAGQIDVRYQ